MLPERQGILTQGLAGPKGLNIVRGGGIANAVRGHGSNLDDALMSSDLRGLQKVVRL